VIPKRSKIKDFFLLFNFLFLLIRSQHKMFLTEEKLIQNMETLSLDLFVNNNTTIAHTSQDDE